MGARRGSGGRRSSPAIAAWALCAAALGSGCLLRTDAVPAAFNDGVLDSGGDPARDPKQRRESIVDRLVWDEVIDGYFGQGPDHGAGYSVAGWLAEAGKRAESFYKLAACNAYGPGPGCDLGRAGSGEVAGRIDEMIRELAGECVHGRSGRPVCEAPGRPDWPAMERAMDEIRFGQAISRAARAVGDALAEGLVDREAVLAGAGSALSRASRYVAGRRWRRERDRPTTGIVVKGGAATGIFSAGVVWTVLHMIHGCMSDPACGAAPPGASRPRRDLRFQLLSGTSTGAMVAIAVDLWSSAETAEARERGIKNLAKWFTCYSLSDLYCVRSAPITRLFESGDGAEKGVLEFDGIEKVLTSCVDDRMRANGAELILNTVDFRTGRLYALSDQAELVTTGDVVQAGLASALLPVIGQPVSKLPVWNPGVGEAVYLDGGIRSEIPLLPLARRGAERVLVVSSSASVLNETRPLKNALSIATRYIDVSTGGVTESELAHASRHAESIRAAEIEACTERLRADSGRLCPPESGCNVRSICRTLDWGSACSPPRDAPIEGDEGADPPAPQPATAPQPAAAPSGPERMRRVVLGDHTIADPRALSILVEPFWAVHGIFRNEDKIDAINGYKFEPAELRRMFRAGAEAARLRCTDLARLLGVVPGKEISSDLEKKLVRWCSPDLPRPAELCDAAPRADGGLRSCGEPPPSFLDACSSAAPPGPGAEGSAR